MIGVDPQSCFMGCGVLATPADVQENEHMSRTGMCIIAGVALGYAAMTSAATTNIVVCKLSDFAKKSTYQAMSPVDFVALKRTVETESMVYREALRLSKMEWESNEEKRVSAAVSSAAASTNKVKTKVSRIVFLFPEDLVAARRCESCGTFTSAKAAQTEIATMEKADAKAEAQLEEAEAGGGSLGFFKTTKGGSPPPSSTNNNSKVSAAAKKREDEAQKAAALIQKYVSQLVAAETARAIASSEPKPAAPSGPMPTIVTH